MNYADIHMHALFDTDDGPATEAQMLRIVDAAYADGARFLCLTPHFHPGYFGDNRARAEEAFRILCDAARQAHPDLELHLANELRYCQGCVSWLNDGLCRTFGETNRVLVDFSERESIRGIVGGLERLLNGGYAPVLAHAERYGSLRGKKQILGELRNNGVLLQLDSKSVFGHFGLGIKMWSKAMLDAHLVDIVASDAHDIRRRPPGMDRCYRYIARKYGSGYADAVCRDNPRKLFLPDDTTKEEGLIYG